jgi:anti-sigma regulatory factor (Ser/Thr protein kinase)
MPTRRFSGGLTAPRHARRAVREALKDVLPQRRLADVELIVSELATNSVRHSGAGEAEELSLEAAVEADRVRVRLFDSGSGFEPHTPAPPATGSAGGYGLVLLEQLSDRWGVQRENGFSVWFEVLRDRLPFGDDRGPRARAA